MMTAATTRPMTADELLNMPDDSFRYELVRGELRKMPFADHVHSERALAIGASLLIHARANRLGRVYGADTGFELAPDHVRAPDAAFVRAERADAAQDSDGFFPGPPDLAVEVISPDDLYMDVEEKNRGLAGRRSDCGRRGESERSEGGNPPLADERRYPERRRRLGSPRRRSRLAHGGCGYFQVAAPPD